MKIDKETAEHYTWGNNCDGWHLLKTDSLSIIEERMPVGTSEKLHYHSKCQQFFCILKGRATFELEGTTVEVDQHQGIHIKPQQKHKVANLEKEDLHFLVISEPKSHGDRTNIEL